MLDYKLIVKVGQFQWFFAQEECAVARLAINLNVFITFSNSWKHKEQISNKWYFVSSSFQYYVLGFFRPFLHFDNFQNGYLTVNIHISGRWQQKVKKIHQNLKLHISNPKIFYFWKFFFCCAFCSWSNSGTFFIYSLYFYKFMGSKIAVL